KAWESDEALGWVYQYFGEEEREDIDERVKEDNYKIAGTDVATKTQLFTPRYIVEWMVDNSLGRTWLEMKGERTNINDEDNCFYLAPLEDSLIDRDEKPVEEITVLDPACGSGHMLFYAFDVLYQMYLEEGEVPEKYIPREILRNNLYGIDIDSGAAQIAALSLYLKAKEKSPEVALPQLNIVSADAVLINGERKDEIIKKARSDLEEEILEQIWRSFDHIREWGSLVQVEDRIDQLLEEHRDTFESKGQTQFTEDGDLTSQSTFVSGGEEETWDEIKNRLMENVRLLAESGLEHNDPVEEMFAEEVEKTVHLLDLFVQNYDVVISNPPYLNSGKMGENLKNFVKQYQGSRDLYSAFIERNLGFVSESGYVSMITMETFMYLSTFEDLRQNLLSRANFVDAAHLENRDEGYMNICFLMRAATEEDNPPSRFNRVLDLDEKIQGLNEITKSNRQSGTHESAYVVNQNSFTSVDGLRFLYWFGADLLSLFEEYPKLGNDSISEISGGIKSGDNSHFLRKVWEIPDSWIGEKYQWFVKGGEGRDFYDKIDMLVRWENQGQNIIDYCDKHGKNYQGLSNPDWYSGESIIFRKFGNVLRAKYLPEDTKFSSGIYKIKPGDEIQDLYLLGYLNSNLFRYIIDGANPSMNFNPSDAELVPIKTDLPEEEETRITELVQLCIDRRKKTLQVMESEKEFDEEYLLSLYQNDITDPKYIEEIYLSDFLILQGKLNQEIFNLYEIPIETREKVNNSFQSNMANYPHITNAGELDTKEQKFRSEIPTKSLPDSEYEKLVSSVDKLKGQSLEDISEELEISPYTIAMIRHERGIYSGDEQNEMAGRLLSYYIGCSIGRWDIKGIDPKSDGILETHREAPTYIRECLEVSFDKGEIENIEEQIENMLGREIEDWIQNRFFRYHHSDEYKRRGQRIPVYWHIESPEGAFSCFLYYHQIDNNTLAKLRGQYLDPRINKLENELETLETQTNGDSPDKDLLNRKEEVQNDLDDIREFRETIDEMIDDGVTVDVEKGIWENIKEWDQYEVLE
ncbi:MAG: BREX-1 system adenine-specific DNA-methyltransferase PglX, partial [Halobacteriaceae archaeon]